MIRFYTKKKPYNIHSSDIFKTFIQSSVYYLQKGFNGGDLNLKIFDFFVAEIHTKIFHFWNFQISNFLTQEFSKTKNFLSLFLVNRF